jgi:hypothetical protein
MVLFAPATSGQRLPHPFDEANGSCLTFFSDISHKRSSLSSRREKPLWLLPFQANSMAWKTLKKLGIQGIATNKFVEECYR